MLFFSIKKLFETCCLYCKPRVFRQGVPKLTPEAQSEPLTDVAHERALVQKQPKP